MENDKIEIRLISATETKFFISSNFDEQDIDFSKVRIELGYKSKEMPNDRLELDVMAQYSYEGEKIVESGCLLTFFVKGITSYIIEREDGVKELPKIMPFAMNVAIGVIRGILTTKTSGTPMAKFPLPLIDTEQLLHL